MAIIGCPECGNKVSDHAPICPNCGVEIAGKITTCRHCGSIVLREYDSCRHCGMPLSGEKTKKQFQTQVLERKRSTRKSTETGKPNGKKRRGWYVIAALLALLFIAGGIYFYKMNESNRENAAFMRAVASSNTEVLRSYLDAFPNAPQYHIEKVQVRLDQLTMIDEEWQQVKMMRAKQPLHDYLAKYPDTGHRAEIENMLDSIDWVDAVKSNTIDIFQQYVSSHPYGSHAEEAREKISYLKATIVQPDEYDKIAKLMRQFFMSVNTRSEARLIATLSPQMRTFLDVHNPTESDVTQWMHRQYKEDVVEVVWKINNDYVINKRDVGNDAYEYSVRFSASEEIKRNEAEKSTTERYLITAQITPDFLLSSMTINK